ncbi:MAG: TatD family hydrolase [Clostridia bacterium]|nr:TatD family hydrolase [Clostridia bacterium]
MPDIKYFDTHAHYDVQFEDDLSEVLDNIYKLGVHKIVDVGYSKESSEDAIRLSNKYDYIYSAVGFHPQEAEKDNNVNILYDWVRDNKKIVAIGEIGLDYHYDMDKKLQKDLFISQIAIANELGLPIIIHNREADMDVLDILKNQMKPNVGVIFHCFSSSLEVAKEVLKHGWYISISGTITFNNANSLIEVAQYVPLDKLLIETDCPYLAPEPFRGRRNDSSKVQLVAEKIAQLKGISIDEVALNTYNNGCKIYNIKE